MVKIKDYLHLYAMEAIRVLQFGNRNIEDEGFKCGVATEELCERCGYA